MSNNFKCKLCGEELEPGLKYCGCCGAEIKTDDQANNEGTSQKQGFSIDFGAQQAPNLNMSSYGTTKFEDDDDVIGDLSNEKLVDKESVFQSLTSDDVLAMPANTSMRGPKKAIIVTCVTLGILAILACCTFIFFPQITMAVLKPQEYYIMQERANIEKANKSFVEYYKTAFNPYAIEGEMKLELFGDQIPAEINDLLKETMLNYTYAQSQNFEKAKGGIGIKIAGETAFESIVEHISDKIILSIPEFSEKKYVSENQAIDWSIRLMTGDENEVIAMTGMTKKQLNDIRDRYIKEVLIEAFPKDSVKKGRGDIDGIKCTTAEFTLDATSLGALTTAFADQLAADKEVNIKLINNTMSYMELHAGGYGMGEVQQITAEDYDMMVDAMRSGSANVGESKYTVYYNSRGKIVAREFKSARDTIRVDTHKKNDVNTIRFSMLSQGMSVATFCQYTETNGIYEGLIGADYDTSELGTIKFKVDTNKKLAGKFIGDMNINIIVNNAINIDIISTVDNDTIKQEIDVKFNEQIINLGAKIIATSKMLPAQNLDSMTVPTEQMTDEEMVEVTAKIGERLMELVVPIIGDIYGGIPMGETDGLLDDSASVTT